MRIHQNRGRAAFIRGTSLTCIAWLACMQPALAQDTTAEPEAIAEPDKTDETSETPSIVVTGTRLGTGFSAPTPITVASADDLKAAAPNNLADGLAQLPQFASSNRTSVGVPSVAIGTTGQNLLNLRGIGFNRNLVLLDGQRIVATNQIGSVDANVLPQAIVSRVETVTGGASAAYGSDAISGVVNFILDRKFEGIKAEASAGISTYGDLPTYLGQLSFGKSLMEGRLNIVLSGEYFNQDGLDGNRATGRDWYDRPVGRIANPSFSATLNPNTGLPVNGPRFFLANDIRSSVGAPGGVIVGAAGVLTTGPLANTRFLPGGATTSYNRGTLTGSAFQSGGDGGRVNASLVPNQERYNVFAGINYEFSDTLSMHADFIHARTHTLQRAFTEPETAAARFTIFQDNFYLPAAVRAQMVALGLPSIGVGRYETDFPLVELEYDTKLYRSSLGFDGKLGRWNWDANYSYGRTDQRATEGNNPISRNLYSAADVVADANGNPICRIRTQPVPAGLNATFVALDQACVPLNIFGEGSPSAAAIDYVLGDTFKDLRQTQHNIAINLRGDLGDNLKFTQTPISLAVGAEYREDKAKQTADDLSLLTNNFAGLRGAPAGQNNRQGAYRFFNPQPFSGSIEVKEAYAEIGVPLIEDGIFSLLDVNAAIRYADYKTSGLSRAIVGGALTAPTATGSNFNATTWKIGGNFAPVEDVRFRITRSRDIRSPNILDLYNGSQFSSSTATYVAPPATVATTGPIFQLTLGNPNLVPEKADTLTFGAVFKPSFIPGFQASVDYYDIKLRSAIGSLSAQQQINRCAAGDQTYCALQSFSNGVLTVLTSPQNLNVQRVQGWDIEAQYNLETDSGRFGLRGFLNVNTKDFIQPAVGSRINLRGGGAQTSYLWQLNPKWRATVQFNYEGETFGLFVQERFIAKSLIDANFVEGVDIDQNDIPAIAYTDVTGTAKVKGLGEFYLTITNLLDTDPPISPHPTTTFSVPYAGTYDALGRTFTVGLRVKM